MPSQSNGIERISHEDRCIGCLLGAACGDILGAAVEGLSASSIREMCGELRDFGDSSRGFGCYTDDTQMTVALTTSLVERGAADAEHISAKYADFYEPWRGYGAAAHTVMRALQAGADYRQTGTSQFPRGSFGNGGAMRIAPIGLAYRHAPDDVLGRAVEAALLCTHVHPEAIDGAFVQTKAVALAATTDSTRLDPRQLLSTVLDLSETILVRRKLEILLEKLDKNSSDKDVIYIVGNGVRTSEAVAAALWAFARYGRTPEECVVRAVGFGGDTDTIGAIVGAQVGSLHGSRWIPSRWYDHIENGRHGRDEIVRLARELAKLDLVSLRNCEG